MSSAVLHNSTLSTPSAISPFDGLPPAQAQVAAALAEGKTISAAAREAGVHRSTIHNWLQTIPDFAHSVEHATADNRSQLADDLTELAAAALGVLRNLLADPETPASVRLKAALAVLDRPRFPDRDWSLPAPVETPARQLYADEMALLASDYKMMRMNDALRKSETHIPAPSAAPPRAEPPTPRNAPCPCGSGLKYKRCCGRSAPPL
ncbi:MAG: SEC-C domain-containing protein [Bryobacteraceae bacterium]|nr:SEC-C domain-containing protein [Bryobacteraceae bacterium]